MWLSSRSTWAREPSERPLRFQASTTSVISLTTSSPSPITKKSTKSANGSGLYVQCPPAHTSGCSGRRSAARTGTPARSTQFSRFV